MKSTGKKVTDQPHDFEMVLNESDDNLVESKVNNKRNKYSEDESPSKVSSKLPLPKFDISEFDKVTKDQEYLSLLSFMKRFQAAEIELDTKLKPFIPSYIPSIGEVDAFLKIHRPDKQAEDLGLTVIDEPTIEGHDPLTFSLIINPIPKESNVRIGLIENAEKDSKQIQNWIDKIGNLRRDNMSTYVNYTKNMPDIESLMQIWHEKLEQCLGEVKLPNESIAMSNADYAKIVCNLLDIPIHNVNSDKSLIEALHVLFSLYSVVKDSVGYAQNKPENVIKFN